MVYGKIIHSTGRILWEIRAQRYEAGKDFSLSLLFLFLFLICLFVWVFFGPWALSDRDVEGDLPMSIHLISVQDNTCENVEKKVRKDVPSFAFKNSATEEEESLHFTLQLV